MVDMAVLWWRHLRPEPLGSLEGTTNRHSRTSPRQFRLESVAWLLTKERMALMDDNPDSPIELLRNAGKQLEQQLMKLHRHHHGRDCETCQALLDWWAVNNR